MNTLKIFLASSSELKDDRVQFELFIGRENKKLVPKALFLELVIWEDFLDAMGPDGLQAEYNKAIKECDVFVMLYFTKVGKYTAEEFETAFGAFTEDGTPLIYTFFKDASINTGAARKDDLLSLWAFQDKLKSLGHYQTVYKNTEDLLLRFRSQLDLILEEMEDATKDDSLWQGMEPQSRSINPDLKNNIFNKGILGMSGRQRLIPRFNRFGRDSFADDKVDETLNADNAFPAKGPSSIGTNPAKPNLLPDEGMVLYSIPEKMQLDHTYRCVVRIATDRKTLVKGLSKDVVNRKFEPDVRIADQMTVYIEKSPHFLVEAIGGVSAQAVKLDRATEWNFNVRPLHAGNHPLDLCISIVLPEGPYIKVLTKTVMVGVEPVEWVLAFEEAPLELVAAAPSQVHSGTGDNVAGDKIGQQINMSSNSTYHENTSATESGAKLKPSKILFVAASPDELDRIQVEKEYRIIKTEMGLGQYRDRYEFLQPQFGVTITDLVRAMGQKPQIVHFSGHGDEKGLILATEDGKSQPMPEAALRRLFKPLQGVGQIVLLNACYSATQATEISKFGLYVVGANEQISDEASLAFAKGLYIGLGDGKSFEDAYNDAMIVLITVDAAFETVLEVWKDGIKLEL